MESNNIIFGSIAAVGIILYYAFKKAYASANDELLPPVDYHDLVTCIHHVRDSHYLLAHTPHTMENCMGFSINEGQAIILTCAKTKHLGSKYMLSMLKYPEFPGIPTSYCMGPNESLVTNLYNAGMFFRGDCIFTDLICQINGDNHLPAYMETYSTLVGLSVCAFILFNPSLFINVMGFGPDSFLSRLSWWHYGSIEKARNPLPLGGLATVALTCFTGYYTVDALSQGLVRPLQAVKVYNEGLTRYDYQPGLVSPNNMGENSAHVERHLCVLESRSFETSAILALGGFLSLKYLSIYLNKKFI